MCGFLRPRNFSPQSAAQPPVHVALRAMRAAGVSLLGLLLPTLVFVGPWSGHNGHNAPRVARSAGPPGLQKALGFVLEAMPVSIEVW